MEIRPWHFPVKLDERRCGDGRRLSESTPKGISFGQSQGAVIDYLMEENGFLREQLGNRRIRFTDAERRRLARNMGSYANSGTCSGTSFAAKEKADGLRELK